MAYTAVAIFLGFATVAGAVTMKTNKSDMHPIARPEDWYEARRPDPCKCKNWAQLWKEEGFKCGMGLENMQMSSEMQLISKHRNRVANKWAESWCDYVLSRLNMPVCINAQLGEREGQWCYTNKACGKLNGGWHVQGADKQWKRAVKFCKAGDKGKDGKVQDHSLKEIMPQRLNMLSKEYNIDPAFLMKMAYPTVKGSNWDDVRKFWSNDRTEMNVFARSRAEEIAEIGMPVIWGTKDHKNFGVTQGQRAWKVGTSDFNKFLWYELFPFYEPFKADAHLSDVKCIYNCKDKKPVAANKL